MIGQVIHNYQIVDALGKGGMGMVYKALDVRLNRFLALKFLAPERITAERKRRFFQEAKAASALNHPSIVHIYDIGQWEGADYIAMEYVEGQTLQQMLRQGPLAVDEALRYAIQVADAMSVAHAANIVHRDLKPANVMVTARGLVKILDFGVAKLNEPAAGPKPELSKSDETLTVADVDQTLAGMIVGSPAYMSPEQATGKLVDARSDIFEFGSLLFEMLTGRAAFSGASKLEVLSAVIHADAPKASSINPAVTPELEWVIAHCLRKDRERRFQSMSEVKIALDDLRTETAVSGIHTTLISASQTAVSGITPAPAPSSANKRTWMWGIATAVGLLFAVALAVFLLRKPTSSGPLEVTRLTTEGGLCIDPAISPDGKLVAYASDRSGEGHFSIWLRQVGGADAVRLTHSSGDDVEPSFSPDGTSIVYRSTRDGGGLYIIPALGGEERKIADAGRQPQFSPDGSKIVYWNGPAEPLPLRDGIAHAYILDLATSTTRRLRSDFPASMHPIWSPDGAHVLFIGLKDPTNMDTFDWWVVPVNGGNPVMCPMFGEYTSFDPFVWRGGQIFFTKNDGNRTTIGEVGIDPKTFKPVGKPRSLTAGTTDEYSPSVSKDGKVAFSSIDVRSDLYSLPLDADRGKVRGEAQRLTRNIGNNIARSLSADGKRLAFTSDRSGVTEIWSKDLTSGQERQLTTGGEKAQSFISPDGASVAWRESGGQNEARIFLTPFQGGVAKQICGDCGVPTGWSPDGRYLIYQPTSAHPPSIGLLELATGKKSEYFKTSNIPTSAGSISADGKWIVFAAPRTLRDFTIYVAPFSAERPPPRSEWVEIDRSNDVDPYARWSPDGELLYFSSDRDGYNCLWAQRLDRATKRPQGQLFAVQHFHVPAAVLFAPAFWYAPALGPEQAVISLKERAGGVWMLNIPN